ncbi:MazF family transcriptional regulator [Candidatus Pacearchaeota archaeon CG10_big_fil_rev_8_21_14_0_10_32_14]|nr:MAG: MazF family transcriptional regulator [Candidatus Pacearchaeota archaeon CG10_big_fil_rev_8_21_14_0_10_32_14]
MIEKGDFLLVPFPFSDQSGRKVRSVIVLSNNEFNKNSEDIIVVGVTSNSLKGKYTIELSSKDLDEGKLMTKCYIKIENILKLNKELIIKKIGKINSRTDNLILNKLLEIIK